VGIAAEFEVRSSEVRKLVLPSLGAAGSRKQEEGRRVPEVWGRSATPLACPEQGVEEEDLRGV